MVYKLQPNPTSLSRAIEQTYKRKFEYERPNRASGIIISSSDLQYEFPVDIDIAVEMAALLPLETLRTTFEMPCVNLDLRATDIFPLDVPMAMEQTHERTFEYEAGSSRAGEFIEYLGSPDLSYTVDDVVDSLRASYIRSHLMVHEDKVAEALQSEASFTVATDKKPIVATFGCSGCVALGGYESANKIAFMVHFSHAREVTSCKRVLYDNITRLVKEKITKPIQLHLRSGTGGEGARSTVEAIKKWMKESTDLPMIIASEDLSHAFGSNSLSIDSRNGNVSDYDPNLNPNRRTLSEVEELYAIMSAYTPHIHIAYRPDGLPGMPCQK